MGKTAPLKQKGGASIHSRAAKRATSPGIDTDKSLKNIQAPTDSKGSRPSVLAVHQGAGVTKKTKNGRKSVLSAKAKRRQEKGMDRAEAVMDKKETRVERSRGRARTVQERAKAWEELNKKIVEKQAKKEALEKGDWEVEDDAESGDNASPVPMDAVAQSIPLPEPSAEEDEVL